MPFLKRRLSNAEVPQLNFVFGCVDRVADLSRYLQCDVLRYFVIIFGSVDCVGDLSHYLQCDVLWYLECSAMKLDDSWASHGGIDRVGFPDPDRFHIYTACVMFKCYHAIRNDHATILDGCIAHNDFYYLFSKDIFLASHLAIDFLC